MHSSKTPLLNERKNVMLIVRPVIIYFQIKMSFTTIASTKSMQVAENIFAVQKYFRYYINL